MRWIGLFALAIGLLPATASAAPPPTACPAPVDLHDGWVVAPPEQKGLDPAIVCAIGPTLEKMKRADPDGVVIVRHGALVYEHYFGVDPIAWNATTVHPIHSISKSVVAILTGIAFDRGWLESLDTPVLSFFPQYGALRTPDKGRITLRDLLTMTSGLDWPEWAVSYYSPSNISYRYYVSDKPYRFVLAQPLDATPGAIWNYNSGGVGILGAILKKVSGQPLDQFAKKALFDPLGIEDWAWDQMANGDPSPSGGLLLRPRGLAKIGQLVLNHGTWNGHRIVSAAWIEAMTARQSPPSWMLGGWAESYGYLWWRGRVVTGSHPFDWVGGLGLGGQRLFVLPSADLVVAVTAGVHTHGGLSDVAGDTALVMALQATIRH